MSEVWRREYQRESKIFVEHITLLHIYTDISIPLMFNMFLFQEGGRLLYIGQNEWTHINCALWSSEVFEDDDGSLKNVHTAVLRGKQLVRHVVHHH